MAISLHHVLVKPEKRIDSTVHGAAPNSTTGVSKV